MNPKKNRVVETPHSLWINGHSFPMVSQVRVEPAEVNAPYREVTVTFLTDSYQFRSKNRFKDKLANRLGRKRYTFIKQSHFKTLLEIGLHKFSKVLLSHCR